jgi:hypothetical protein
MLMFVMTIFLYGTLSASTQEVVSHRAHKGHENDKDANDSARVHQEIGIFSVIMGNWICKDSPA